MKTVIEMASEAGITIYNNERSSVECEAEHLERFAALVREECAKICDNGVMEGTNPWTRGYASGCKSCADGIRGDK